MPHLELSSLFLSPYLFKKCAHYPGITVRILQWPKPGQGLDRLNISELSGAEALWI